MSSYQIFIIHSDINNFNVLLLSTRKTLYLTLYLNNSHIGTNIIGTNIEGFRLSEDQASIYCHTKSYISQYRLDGDLISTQTIDLYSIKGLENLCIDYEGRRAFYSSLYGSDIFIKQLDNNTISSFDSSFDRFSNKITHIAPHINKDYIIVYIHEYHDEYHHHGLTVFNTKEKKIAYQLLLDHQPELFDDHISDNIITTSGRRYNRDYLLDRLDRRSSFLDTGESIVANSFLCFYDISNAFSVSINHRFELYEPMLHNSYPFLLHRIFGRTLGLFSMVQKKTIDKINFEDKISDFNYYQGLKGLIFAESYNNRIYIYDLNQKTFLPEILLPKILLPRDAASAFDFFPFRNRRFYFLEDRKYLFTPNFIFDLNSKKLILHTELKTIINDIYFDKLTNRLFAFCQRSGGYYDVENGEVKILLEIECYDLNSNDSEKVLSKSAGRFVHRSLTAPPKLLSINEKLYIIHAGCLYDFNSVKNKLEELHTLSDKAENFIYLSRYDILIFSCEGNINFYDFKNFKLIYKLEHPERPPYRYMPGFRLEFNETLNLLYFQYNYGDSYDSFWHLDLDYHQVQQATLLYTNTVQTQLKNIKLNDKTLLDAKNQFLFENMHRSEEAPLVETRTFGQTRYPIADADPIPDAGIHLFKLILDYLSYREKLMFSAFNKEYRKLANAHSSLFTTDDVNYLTESRIKPYLTQFFVNNFCELPKFNSIDVKPHRTKKHSLEVGFFSKGSRKSLDIDVDLLIQGRFKFTQQF